jgi:hypothetical protein
MFLPFQAGADVDLPTKVATLIAARKPLLVTRQLAERLSGSLDLKAAEVEVLDVPADPWELMQLPAERLQSIRDRMTAPLGIRMEAPTRVALYLFDGGVAAVENFNDVAVQVQLRTSESGDPRLSLAIPRRSARISPVAGGVGASLAPRSLAVVEWAR